MISLLASQFQRLLRPFAEFRSSLLRVEAGDAEEDIARRGNMLLVVLGLSFANLLWTGLYHGWLGNALFSTAGLAVLPVVAAIACAYFRGADIDRLTKFTVFVFYAVTFATTLGAGGRWPGGVFTMTLVPAAAVILIDRRAGLNWTVATILSLAAAGYVGAPDGSGFFELATAEQARDATFRAASLITVVVSLVAFFYSSLNQKTNEALRESLVRSELGERRFQAITEHAYDLIAELDDEGRVTYVSPGVEEGTGVKPEKLIGERVLDFVHAEDLTTAKQLWRVLMEKGAVRQSSLRFQAPLGRVIWLEASMRSYRADGEKLRIVVIARDVSERLERESLLRHQQSLITVGTMAAGAAHQLNDPISSILAASQFAIHSAEDNDYAQTSLDALSVIEIQAQRSGKILRSMMAFAREEDCERWSEDLHELLHRAVRTIETEEGPLSAEIVMSLCPEAPRVMMSPLEFEQAVINLIRNAVQAQASVIVVGTGVADRRTVEVTISDDGVGLTEAAKASAFEPFFSTRPSSRSGLGLTLARRIVDEHFGELDFVETDEEGTIFRIRLPQLRLVPGGAQSPTPRASLD